MSIQTFRSPLFQEWSVAPVFAFAMSCANLCRTPHIVRGVSTLHVRLPILVMFPSSFEKMIVKDVCAFHQPNISIMRDFSVIYGAIVLRDTKCVKRHAVHIVSKMRIEIDKQKLHDVSHHCPNQHSLLNIASS